MNERDFEQLVHWARKIGLDSGERKALRGAVLTHIAARPTPLPKRSAHEKIRFSAVSWLLASRPAAAVALILAVTLGGTGISFAAEGTVPGDVLYPIKIGVNENVRDLLAVSPQAAAAWNAQKIERRLEETEKLMARGVLDPDVREDMERRLQEHAAGVNSGLQDLSSGGQSETAVELNTRLERSLRAHERALRTIVGDTPAPEETTASAAQAEPEEATPEQERSAEDKSLQPPLSAVAGGRGEVAEEKIERARAAIEKTRSSRPSEVSSGAILLLTLAEQATVDGRTKLEEGAFGQALLLFHRAYRLAEEAEQVLSTPENAKSRRETPSAMKEGAESIVNGSTSSGRPSKEEDHPADEESHSPSESIQNREND